MNSKTFTTLLVALTFLCSLLTVAHMLYAIDAYDLEHFVDEILVDTN